MIERLGATWRALPVLVQIGLGLALAAFLADIAVHLSPTVHDHGAHRPGEHAAHLAVLLSMVVILAGVVIDGARRSRSSRRDRAVPGGHSHAPR